MNKNNESKSLIRRFNFKCIYGLASEKELDKAGDRGPRLWISNGAKNKIEECANREYGVHDVKKLLFARFVRGVYNAKNTPKEQLLFIYDIESQLKNDSRLSSENKADYSRASFLSRFKQVIKSEDCFDNSIIFNPIKYNPNNELDWWAEIKVFTLNEKNVLVYCLVRNW